MGHQIINLDQLCKVCAPIYESMGYPAPTAKDVLDLVVEEEKERVARLNAGFRERENYRPERTFLRDERGSAYGYVAAEIPEDLFTQIASKHNARFGPDVLDSPAGLKEVLKAYPECGVKQTGMKFHGHMQTARRNFGRINWGRGTMTFAS